MTTRPGSRLAAARRWAALAHCCLRSHVPSRRARPARIRPGEWRTFEGSWTSAGTRQTLDLGPDHRASIFDLTGSLLLTGRAGPPSVPGAVIGFADNLAGMHGRSVWTDERGDQVYSELKSESTGTGDRIIGTVLGGTGRYAGVTGEYSFRWQYMVDSEDGAVSGRWSISGAGCEWVPLRLRRA